MSGYAPPSGTRSPSIIHTHPSKYSPPLSYLDDMKNQQQVILITGASSGIGHATARRLLDGGHNVYAGARRAELMQDLEQAGGVALQMDVTQSDDISMAIDRIMHEHGRIDAVVANAGYCLLGPAELVSIEDAQRQLDTNVLGVGRVIRAALPYMRHQGSGRIVIVSSTVGQISLPMMSWYAASKHALEGYADALRMEVKPLGIQVSLVEPGYIKTNIANVSLPSLDTALQVQGADAYRPWMESFRKRWSTATNTGASPDTIARVIEKAITARRPRRRYHPNPDATAAIIGKRLLDYPVLDRILPRVTIR